MRSAAYGWEIDMYLQANQTSIAINFYTKLGFEKMQSNSVMNLPEKWHQIINKIDTPHFYLKFVTNNINKLEVKGRALTTGAKLN